MTSKYRDLLGKYIEHVEECEGVTFLTSQYKTLAMKVMTEQEWDLLREVEDEVMEDGS